MFAKKATTVTGAPILIAIITLLIIIYVLALPPADRANLLGEQTTTVTTPGQVVPNQGIVKHSGKETLLSEVPGNIDYTALNELEIPLNAFTLYKTVDAKEVEEFNPFYIKNGLGDKSSKNISFNIENLENMDNFIMTFTAKKNDGILSVKLNGVSIYEYDIESPQSASLKLKKTMLQEENTLEFSVSGVGFNFWKTNEYTIEGLKIIADVTDTSRQESMNSFFVSETQGGNIERAKLEFNPECKTSEVGKLTVALNDRTVFSGIPDCGSLNFVDLAPNMIIVGKNKINFYTDKGSYLMDLIKIKLEFEDNEIPVYYFDMDESYFNLKYDVVDDGECGKMDGLCPDMCDEDNDYDCCMKEYTTPYWCVALTANEDDKCVGFVTADNIDRCPTNYMDKSKRVADDGEDLCGDNKDGECPAGCSIDYDKDCCFDQTGDQYWCEFMPTNGLNYRCMNSVSLGQCDICPTGYNGEGKSAICSPVGSGFESEELKPDYSVLMTMKFTDDTQRKKGDIYVNGHLMRLETPGLTYQKDISELVVPGSNSIEIVPFSDLNIRELKVDVLT
jgi:hypothetical protein